MKFCGGVGDFSQDGSECTYRTRNIQLNRTNERDIRTGTDI